MPRILKQVRSLVAAVTLLLGAAGDVFGELIQLTPSGSFPLQRLGAGGLAADSDTVYQTFVNISQMDTYSTSGTFLGTVPLTGGPATLLGGYTGATVMDSEHLLLTAMYNDLRNSSIYTFTRSGTFVSQAVISPAVNNTTSIAFDGTSAYVAQNDNPFLAYRVNVNTGAVEQTFGTNPGHGQRLGLDYWLNGNLLFESYDSGVSVLNPLTGNELQHFTAADLGYTDQTFGDQTFGAAIAGDTLYLTTQTTVFKYSISVVPEPSSLIMGSTAAR